jgi:hypothetical protein
MRKWHTDAGGLAGHHSASFILAQIAEAVPQQLEEAGEKVAMVVLAARGSIFVATSKVPAPERRKAFDLIGAPGEIRAPGPVVRTQVLGKCVGRLQQQPAVN